MESEQSLSLSAKQTVSYNVELCDSVENLISKCVESGTRSDLEAKRAVFIDQGLPSQFKQQFLEGLQEVGLSYSVLEIPGDEENKALPNVLTVVEHLNKLGVKRRSAPSIVVGGGVTLDVVGLATSLYRRGVPYIRVPTTLLSMVDVGVAAKTGANHLGYRNRIGTFHPAMLTLVFPGYLSTLPRRQMSNGAGEIFKLAVIKDNTLFEILENRGSDFVEFSKSVEGEIKKIIFRALKGMAVELEGNLWEHDLQRVVDYGHSFSPLVEMTYISELLHGEAVTLDCLFSAVLSFNRGYLCESDLQRLFDVARRLLLPTFHRGFTDIGLLERALADTTVHRNGEQHLPLPSSIGSAIFVNDLTSEEIRKASALMAQLSDSGNSEVQSA
ncbi:MAG: sedoheptulose 7-phosphate cyclase [Segniliparus sp.]|uniref:sedoheptulose 7-phosphate cyclase n=1 Tax=Segniliparus sp. TaxID=2804064 RepID=UPI003F3592A2